MTNAASDVEGASGWDEVRFILKCVTPFATLVWSGTLCWALTEDLRWTIPSAIVLTAIAGATLFGRPERVIEVWLAVFRVATIVVTFAIVGGILYFGVKATIALAGWIMMFPFHHPFLFIGGIALLVVAAGGVAGTPDAKPQLVHDRLAAAPGHNTTSGTQLKRKKKRKRRSWSIRTRIEVWERSKRRCYYCDEKLESWRGCDMHLDHKIPFSKNGDDVESNLVAACPCCNHEKHAKQLPGLHR